MRNSRYAAFSPLNTGVLRFPYSHMLNKGEIFASLQFQEWYSWQGLLKEESGKEWGLYLCFYQVVRDGKISYPYHVALVDFETGEVRAHEDESPNLKSEVSAEEAPLTFTYEEPRRWTIAYDSDADSWYVYFRNREVPLEFEVKFAGVHEFTFASPSSVITMGQSKGGACYDPLRLMGLAHRYFDVNRKVESRMMLGGDELALQGKACFDHQWGNFNHLGFHHKTYDRFMISLDDKTHYELDLWFDDKNEQVPSLNRLAIDNDGRPTYAQGNGVCADEILGQEEIDGKSFPITRKLSFDGKEYVLKPKFQKQIMDDVKKGAPAWHGWADVHEGSPEGDKVGVAFMEVYGR